MTDSQFRKEYFAHIYAVQDYIGANLANNFSLDELANVACFSKYH